MNIQTNPMQIYRNTDHINLQNSQNSQSSQKNLNADSRQTSGGKTDSVDFSADARLLAEATRVALHGAETDAQRTDKVARLKSEVQNGTYQVNERGIAEGLAREESLLFQV